MSRTCDRRRPDFWDDVLRDAAAAPTDNPVENVTSLGGGCINEAYRLELRDGRRLFAKANRDVPADCFSAEATGLDALRSAAPESLLVPSPIATGTRQGVHYLVTEWVQEGRFRPADRSWSFDRDFGVALARLHRRSEPGGFGFECKNYLGSWPQTNGPIAPTTSWAHFFREYRLAPQIEAAARAQRLSGGDLRTAQSLLDRLDELLPPWPRPCLIHGDLWAGNVLQTRDGASIIDPAPYAADREAELGMTQLFGNFSTDFYDAYDGEWPLEPGWRSRVPIYTLYHLLNHLNLFGSSYAAACSRQLRSIGPRAVR